MTICPRCHSDGTPHILDCGCQVCGDCCTENELVKGCCVSCRKPKPACTPMIFIVRCYDVEAVQRLLALAGQLGLNRMMFLDDMPKEKRESTQ